MKMSKIVEKKIDNLIKEIDKSAEKINKTEGRVGILKCMAITANLRAKQRMVWVRICAENREVIEFRKFQNYITFKLMECK